MKRFLYILLFCVSTLMVENVSAQIRFYATVNTKTVPLNQNFQLNYTVENGEATQLNPPPLNDFQVLSGPNTSQSVQWVNGNVSQSVTYSYILRPKKEGTFKIGKGVAKISGANVESNELSITVTEAAQQQAQQQRRNPFFDPFDDPFFRQDPFDPFQQFEEEQEEQRQPQQKQPTPDLSKEIKDNVFVRLNIDRSNVYVGEKVSAVLKMYFKLNFGNVSITKAPTFNGFWSQEVKIDPNQKPQIENINGQQYYAVEIQKFNLYPQKSGTLNITAAELNMIVQAQVQRQRRSIWDNFFGPQVQNVPYKPISNAASVYVKELPEAGKPEDFSGAVGKFNFTTNFSSKDAKTDDALTYTVSLSGTGNLNLVELPAPVFPEGFEVYEPKVKENFSNTSAGLSGNKQADYLVIPHEPGEYKIPKMTLSYFDPSLGKYQTISAAEYNLKITGEPSKATTSQSNYTAQGANKKDVNTIGTDIRFIKNPSKLEKDTKPFVGSIGFIALSVAPFLLFMAAVFWKRRNEDAATDIVGSKKRRATKLARKRLATAEKNMQPANRETFYDEISKAIWGYLSDKLSIDFSQLTKDNVEEKLIERNVTAEKISDLKSILSDCERALYTPDGGSEELKNNYTRAVQLIADLEDEIKS